ncbi:hypothetical protein BDZ88DRAFT_246895 [Geranomyces variabilis]|nr:hypothetical protein BDZ88DRAFT_246895 [Geranomyces variabilis]
MWRAAHLSLVADWSRKSKFLLPHAFLTDCRPTDPRICFIPAVFCLLFTHRIMDSQSRVIGQMGSTTEFFKLDSNRRISWSLIQHAKCISYQKYTQSYFFDDLRVPVPYDHYSADSGHALTRMMTELSEVVKRKEVLAANKALDKRVEEIENQIIRLWKPRAVPVTKLQGWSLRIS